MRLGLILLIKSGETFDAIFHEKMFVSNALLTPVKQLKRFHTLSLTVWKILIKWRFLLIHSIVDRESERLEGLYFVSTHRVNRCWRQSHHTQR